MESKTTDKDLLDKLTFLYGAAQAPIVLQRLSELIKSYQSQDAVVQPRGTLPVDHRDVILITYGDQVHSSNATPLQTLKLALDTYFKDAINTVHLLPHFPYSSDDGFSVIDYRTVDPNLGDWADIRSLGNNYRFMFDAVINHISSQSEWFQEYLKGHPRYRDYFIEADPADDLSAVYRPRALPLLTEVNTAHGTRHVWTTFSKDQIDLNFKNPEVLLEIIDILLLYVQQGARLLRLDAIGFLWKESGTNCFHLEQTHAAVKLIRDVMDRVRPEVMLVPEINGTLEENLGYFGDGTDEAQMVYNFALAPLTLDAFARGDGSILSSWLRTLPPTSQHTTLFNFLASHDGIGVRAASGILSDIQMQALVSRTEACGGRVNFRYDAKGAKVPYELATTLYDVLSAGSTSEHTNVARFICAHGIMCAIAGVPGVYFHSFLGTSNWQEGFAQTEHARTLNRRKFSWPELQSLLSVPQSRASQVHSRMTQLLRARAAEPAFHPSATQRILEVQAPVVAIERARPDGSANVIALHNVAELPITCQLPGASKQGHEILTNTSVDCSRPIALEPYDIKWIRLPS